MFRQDRYIRLDNKLLQPNSICHCRVELKDEPMGMDLLITKLLDNNCKVTCYPIEDGWFDIGQFDEYKKLVSHLGNPDE